MSLELAMQLRAVNTLSASWDSAQYIFGVPHGFLSIAAVLQVRGT